MSLVNDMLNDLEQRRSREPAGSLSLDFLNGQSTSRRRRSLKPLYVIVGLAAIALVAVIAWLYKPGQGLIKARQALDEAAIASESAVADAVRLQTANWLVDDSATRLRLAFNGIKPYSISRSGAQLVLHFYGVANGMMQEDLTPEPPVTSATLSRSNSDLLVTLTIAGDFAFSDRLLKDAAHTVELTIRPQAAKPEKPAADEAAQAPVSPVPQPVSTTQPQQHSAPIPAPKSPQQAVAVSKPEAVKLTPSQRDLRTADRARKLMQQGDAYGAQQVLEALLAKQPGAPRSARLLASLWLSQQRFQRASELIEFQLTKDPGDIELRLLKARLLMARGDTGAAVDWLMTAAPAIEAQPDYYELLGFAARQSQQYALSEQTYRGLVASDGGRGDWWVGLGIALDAQAKIAEARGAYRRALADTRLSGPLKRYAQQRLSGAN